VEYKIKKRKFHIDIKVHPIEAPVTFTMLLSAGNWARCFTELLISSLAVAVTIAPTCKKMARLS